MDNDNQSQPYPKLASSAIDQLRAAALASMKSDTRLNHNISNDEPTENSRTPTGNESPKSPLNDFYVNEIPNNIQNDSIYPFNSDREEGEVSDDDDDDYSNHLPKIAQYKKAKSHFRRIFNEKKRKASNDSYFKKKFKKVFVDEIPSLSQQSEPSKITQKLLGNALEIKSEICSGESIENSYDSGEIWENSSSSNNSISPHATDLSNSLAARDFDSVLLAIEKNEPDFNEIGSYDADSLYKDFLHSDLEDQNSEFNTIKTDSTISVISVSDHSSSISNLTPCIPTENGVVKAETTFDNQLLGVNLTMNNINHIIQEYSNDQIETIKPTKFANSNSQIDKDYYPNKSSNHQIYMPSSPNSQSEIDMDLGSDSDSSLHYQNSNQKDLGVSQKNILSNSKVSPFKKSKALNESISFRATQNLPPSQTQFGSVNPDQSFSLLLEISDTGDSCSDQELYPSQSSRNIDSFPVKRSGLNENKNILEEFRNLSNSNISKMSKNFNSQPIKASKIVSPSPYIDPDSLIMKPNNLTPLSLDDSIFNQNHGYQILSREKKLAELKMEYQRRLKLIENKKSNPEPKNVITHTESSNPAALKDIKIETSSDLNHNYFNEKLFNSSFPSSKTNNSNPKNPTDSILNEPKVTKSESVNLKIRHPLSEKLELPPNLKDLKAKLMDCMKNRTELMLKLSEIQAQLMDTDFEIVDLHSKMNSIIFERFHSSPMSNSDILLAPSQPNSFQREPSNITTFPSKHNLPKTGLNTNEPTSNTKLSFTTNKLNLNLDSFKNYPSNSLHHPSKPLPTQAIKSKYDLNMLYPKKPHAKNVLLPQSETNLNNRVNSPEFVKDNFHTGDSKVKINLLTDSTIKRISTFSLKPKPASFNLDQAFLSISSITGFVDFVIHFLELNSQPPPNNKHNHIRTKNLVKSRGIYYSNPEKCLLLTFPSKLPLNSSYSLNNSKPTISSIITKDKNVYTKYKSIVSSGLKSILLGDFTQKNPYSQQVSLEDSKICTYESSGGYCNDDNCRSVHFKDFNTLKIDEIIFYLSHYPTFSEKSKGFEYYKHLKDLFISLSDKIVTEVKVIEILRNNWKSLVNSPNFIAFKSFEAPSNFNTNSLINNKNSPILDIKSQNKDFSFQKLLKNRLKRLETTSEIEELFWKQFLINPTSYQPQSVSKAVKTNWVIPMVNKKLFQLVKFHFSRVKLDKLSSSVKKSKNNAFKRYYEVETTTDLNDGFKVLEDDIIGCALNGIIDRVQKFELLEIPDFFNEKFHLDVVDFLMGLCQSDNFKSPDLLDLTLEYIVQTKSLNSKFDSNISLIESHYPNKFKSGIRKLFIVCMKYLDSESEFSEKIDKIKIKKLVSNLNEICKLASKLVLIKDQCELFTTSSIVVLVWQMHWSFFNFLIKSYSINTGRSCLDINSEEFSASLGLYLWMRSLLSSKSDGHFSSILGKSPSFLMQKYFYDKKSTSTTKNGFENRFGLQEHNSGDISLDEIINIPEAYLELNKLESTSLRKMVVISIPPKYVLQKEITNSITICNLNVSNWFTLWMIFFCTVFDPNYIGSRDGMGMTLGSLCGETICSIEENKMKYISLRSNDEIPIKIIAESIDVLTRIVHLNSKKTALFPIFSSLEQSIYNLTFPKTGISETINFNSESLVLPKSTKIFLKTYPISPQTSFEKVIENLKSEDAPKGPFSIDEWINNLFNISSLVAPDDFGIVNLISSRLNHSNEFRQISLSILSHIRIFIKSKSIGFKDVSSFKLPRALEYLGNYVKMRTIDTVPQLFSPESEFFKLDFQKMNSLELILQCRNALFELLGYGFEFGQLVVKREDKSHQLIENLTQNPGLWLLSAFFHYNYTEKSDPDHLISKMDGFFCECFNRLLNSPTKNVSPDYNLVLLWSEYVQMNIQKGFPVKIFNEMENFFSSIQTLGAKRCGMYQHHT
ncbi:hypothetical protein AYI68_g7969 [Smittium mucronatum]|uniref:Putative zinc-finger domain-containing protein n=1 Tax=Smittium mucronatum TaxID=133383 RepID=A0A1R0GM86_9FUNG|nr:hypothetical protein AYI68_g7969 [Smittium mucronatum]